jgi:hypothetical protein
VDRLQWIRKKIIVFVLALLGPLTAHAQPFTGPAEIVVWYYVMSSGPILLPEQQDRPWRVGMYLTKSQCAESERIMARWVIVPCVPAIFRETNVTPWPGYTFYSGERSSWLEVPSEAPRHTD